MSAVEAGAFVRARVRRALLWLGGSRLISQVLTWVITLIVMRLLQPADYGLLAMAGIFVNFMVLLAEAGLATAVIQWIRVDATKLRHVFGAVILVDLTLFGILIAAAPSIALFFGEPRLTELVWALSLQFPMMMLSAIPTALLSRELEFKHQSLIDMGSAIGGGVMVLGLALLDCGVWALVGGSLFSQLMRTVTINIVAPYFVRPIFSMAGMRESLRFGAQVTGARVLWFAYSQADQFIAGRLLGKDLLGAYSVAIHLASLPVQKVASILNQVTLPAFARAQLDPASISRYLLDAVALLSLVSFPIMWGIASVAPEIVAVLLGEKWQAAIFPLQVLPLVMPLTMLSTFFNSAFQGIGQAGIVFRNALTASMLMIFAFLIGARWGLPGLSLAWVFAFPLVLCINLRRMLGLAGLSFRDLAPVVLRALLGAAVMVIVVNHVRSLLPFELAAPSRLMVLIAIGAATYVTMTGIVNRRAVALVRELVKT